MTKQLIREVKYRELTKFEQDLQTRNGTKWHQFEYFEEKNGTAYHLKSKKLSIVLFVFNSLRIRLLRCLEGCFEEFLLRAAVL